VISETRVPLLWSALAAALLHAALLLGIRFEIQSAPADPEEPPLEVSLAPPLEDAPPALLPSPRAPAAPPPEPAAQTAPAPKPAPRPARKPEATPPAPPAAAQVPMALPSAAPGTGSVASTAPRAAPAQRGLVRARPRYRHNPEPPYPLEARRRRQQGTVRLSVEVSAAGRPESIAVARSSGYAALDAAAREAVESWAFEPARQDGEPVASQVEIPIRFELQ
jgi:periplasmic protein TonB